MLILQIKTDLLKINYFYLETFFLVLEGLLFLQSNVFKKKKLEVKIVKVQTVNKL